MKKRILSFMVFGLLAAGLICNGSAAHAQFQEDEPSSEKREKIRKRIETLRMWKLTEALDLDEETSARLFPLLSKFDKQRAQLQQSIRKDMRELRRALRSQQDADFAGIVGRLETNHREMQRIKDEEFQELKTVLSPKQQAQLILFNMKFRNEMRKMIEESRGKRGGRSRPGPERGDRNRPDRDLHERP